MFSMAYSSGAAEQTEPHEKLIVKIILVKNSIFKRLGHIIFEE